MKAEEILEKVKDLIERGDLDELRDELSGMQPADVADLIAEIPEEEQIIIFNALSRELSVEAFDYFDFNVQKRLIEEFDSDQQAFVLNRMSPDDRTSLFEELPSPEVTRLLVLLNPEERAISLSLLGYPEYSIGRLMTPDYLAVKKDWTVREVLDYIRRYGKDSETLNVIYVVDDEGFLVDDIRVREFLLSSPNTKVSDLMDEKFVALNAMDDQEKAVAFFKRDNRVALPVVNPRGILVGIVTIDDVLEVAQEEDTEDIQKLGGVEALQEPYLDIPLMRMFTKRVGWLVILFVGEMLTATAMGFFENELKRALVLSLFIPLIISSGGNTGSQAATLIIRAMALGEVTIRDWWTVMRREIISGLLLGLVLGTLGFARIALWTYFSAFFTGHSLAHAAESNMYGPHWFFIGLTVAFSLIGVVLWGTLSGSMLPLFLKRLGLDPATSSAPFVATMVDVTGLVIYFSIAMMLLKGTYF